MPASWVSCHRVWIADAGSGPPHVGSRALWRAGETHDAAVQRMIQAGVIPTTWLSIASEYQRTWANAGTAAGFSQLINDHTAPFGMHSALNANRQKHAA